MSLLYKNGFQPLHLYAQSGMVDELEKLLNDPKVDVNIKDKDGCVPLHFAAKNGKKECVKILLAHPNIQVNIRDTDGQTPLRRAEESYSLNKDEIIALLKAKGAVSSGIPTFPRPSIPYFRIAS